MAFFSCPGGYHLPWAPKSLAAGDLTFPDNGKQLTPKSRLVGAKPAIYSLLIDNVAHACPVRRESDKRVYSPETFTHNIQCVSGPSMPSHEDSEKIWGLTTIFLAASGF